MRRFILIWLLVISGCQLTLKQPIIYTEDELFISRKYVGRVIDYRVTEKQKWGDPKILWVKTTQDSIYGIMPCYMDSRKVKFEKNERVYIRREFVRNCGEYTGYYHYVLENDKWSYTLVEVRLNNQLIEQ